MLFPLPEATSGVITMETLVHLILCLVLFAYLYLVLVHKEFVVSQGRTVVNTRFLVCVCSDAVGRKMLKGGPMGRKMLKKEPLRHGYGDNPGYADISGCSYMMASNLLTSALYSVLCQE